MYTKIHKKRGEIRTQHKQTKTNLCYEQAIDKINLWS